MSFYCSPNQIGNGPNKYLPKCSFNDFDNGFQSHIRGVGYGLYNGAIFPGTIQPGNLSGANGPIFIENDGVGPLVELKRNYDGKGQYNVYWP
jgi:hypothetical protein